MQVRGGNGTAGRPEARQSEPAGYRQGWHQAALGFQNGTLMMAVVRTCRREAVSVDASACHGLDPDNVLGVAAWRASSDKNADHRQHTVSIRRETLTCVIAATWRMSRWQRSARIGLKEPLAYLRLGLPLVPVVCQTVCAYELGQ